MSEANEPVIEMMVATAYGDGKWLTPIGASEVRSLASDLVTIIDATGMSSSQAKAVKSLLVKRAYSWFESETESAWSATVGSGYRPVRVRDIGVSGEHERHLDWVVTNVNNEIALIANESDGPGETIARIRKVEGMDGFPEIIIEWADGGRPDPTGRAAASNDWRPEDIEYVWSALASALGSSPHLFDAY